MEVLTVSETKVDEISALSVEAVNKATGENFPANILESGDREKVFLYKLARLFAYIRQKADESNVAVFEATTPDTFIDKDSTPLQNSKTIITYLMNIYIESFLPLDQQEYAKRELIDDVFNFLKLDPSTTLAYIASISDKAQNMILDLFGAFLQLRNSSEVTESMSKWANATRMSDTVHNSINELNRVHSKVQVHKKYIERSSSR